MKLKPRLQKGVMLLSFGSSKIETGRREVSVDVWKNVGLAIHKDVCGWVISHVESGKSILKYMKTREIAISYMMKVRGILPSWNFTLEQWDKRNDRLTITKSVRILQNEITNKL